MILHSSMIFDLHSLKSLENQMLILAWLNGPCNHPLFSRRLILTNTISRSFFAYMCPLKAEGKGNPSRRLPWMSLIFQQSGSWRGLDKNSEHQHFVISFIRINKNITKTVCYPLSLPELLIKLDVLGNEEKKDGEKRTYIVASCKSCQICRLQI